jgi:hypothetical protein
MAEENQEKKPGYLSRLFHRGEKKEKTPAETEVAPVEGQVSAPDAETEIVPDTVPIENTLAEPAPAEEQIVPTEAVEVPAEDAAPVGGAEVVEQEAEQGAEDLHTLTTGAVAEEGHVDNVAEEASTPEEAIVGEVHTPDEAAAEETRTPNEATAEEVTPAEAPAGVEAAPRTCCCGLLRRKAKKPKADVPAAEPAAEEVAPAPVGEVPAAEETPVAEPVAETPGTEEAVAQEAVADVPVEDNHHGTKIVQLDKDARPMSVFMQKGLMDAEAGGPEIESDVEELDEKAEGVVVTEAPAAETVGEIVPEELEHVPTPNGEEALEVPELGAEPVNAAMDDVKPATDAVEERIAGEEEVPTEAEAEKVVEAPPTKIESLLEALGEGPEAATEAADADTQVADAEAATAPVDMDTAETTIPAVDEAQEAVPEAADEADTVVKKE